MQGRQARWAGGACSTRRMGQMGLALASVLPLAAPAQDVARGQQIVESRCFACHSLDSNRVGPALRGVVGRHAGRAPDFDYSPALAAATHTWDAAGIQRWLTNPEALIPGQVMNFRLESPQEREDVVAYLSTLSVSGRP